jgi:hypothetical protein
MASTGPAGHSVGRIPGESIGRGYATGSTANASGALTMVAVRRPRTFVPVDELEHDAPGDAEASPDGPAPGPVTRVPGIWWLWGDPEPWPET